MYAHLYTIHLCVKTLQLCLHSNFSSIIFLIFHPNQLKIPFVTFSHFLHCNLCNRKMNGGCVWIPFLHSKSALVVQPVFLFLPFHLPSHHAPPDPLASSSLPTCHPLLVHKYILCIFIFCISQPILLFLTRSVSSFATAAFLYTYSDCTTDGSVFKEKTHSAGLGEFLILLSQLYWASWQSKSDLPFKWLSHQTRLVSFAHLQKFSSRTFLAYFCRRKSIAGLILGDFPPTSYRGQHARSNQSAMSLGWTSSVWHFAACCGLRRRTNQFSTRHRSGRPSLPTKEADIAGDQELGRSPPFPLVLSL